MSSFVTKALECPVCCKRFSNKRSFRRHYNQFFDPSSNCIINHGSDEETTNSKKVDEDLDDPLADLFQHVQTELNHPSALHEDEFTRLQDQFEECLAEKDLEKGGDEIDNSLYEDESIAGQEEFGIDSDGEENKSDDELNDEEDADPEIWDVDPSEVDDDLGIHKSFDKSTVNSVLFCFLYGILYFQTVHHISDNGLEFLLRFIFQFLNVIGLSVNNQFLTELCLVFPTSVYMLRKLTNLERDSFKRYVICTSCCKLYHLYECVVERNGERSAKLCSNEYMYRGRSVKCNSPLMKQIVLKGGVVKFYPLKVYCYNSVISGIENILCKNGIPNLLDHWKDWKYDQNSLFRDIYDGNVWKKFLSYKSSPFLSDSRNLALMLNVDWFQPFKNRNYSVGVIYLVILNLPRSIRFKSENVIVVGLIPALPKEPNLNSFLEPLVAELQVLWKGIRLKTSLSSSSLTFRAALLSVACDIPAARKCCGFKSHSALLGCHKCFKSFPGSFGEKRNYSGFNRESWKPRNKQLHNLYARKVKACSSKSAVAELSKKYGTYYSVLIELEYFDAVQFCVIDPMHNLFLGTAKKVFKTWIEKDILTPEKLKKVEERISECLKFTDIGRIPSNISGNYGTFKAAEWKNWTCIFSLYALCGIVSDSQYKCWEKFVLACRLLCKPVLTTVDIEKADLLLLNFCKQFEQLHGQFAVTPNMHLHCHLKECLFDFGPVHVFWCFTFERFNGLFGNYHTNNRVVEIQFMRHIMTEKHLDNLYCEVQQNSSFEFFQDLFKSNVSGSFRVQDVWDVLRISQSSRVDFSDCKFQKCIGVPPVYKIKSLDKDDIVYLFGSYRKMYPSASLNMDNMNEVIKRFSTMTILGERFGSKLDYRTSKSIYVLANWFGVDGEIEISDPSVELRPCRIDFFFSHVLDINGVDTKHYFAKVSWFKSYHDRLKYGKAMQLWYNNKFEAGGEASFLPVHRIHSRFSQAVTGRSKDLMCVNPVPRRIFESFLED